MLLHSLLKILIFTISVLLTAKIVPGIRVKSFGSAFVFAIVLALLNFFLWWILVALSLPLIVVTLGLFLFVLNAILWLLADKLVSGVELSGFGAALIGSIVTSLINWAILYVLR
jgi:putative membrane protein